MTWIVEDTPAEAPAQRSNAKRKKSSTTTTSTIESLSEPSTTTPTEGESNDNDDAKKELSKSQRKRARHQGKMNMSEEELAWNQVSLLAAPPMPAPEVSLVNNKKKNNTTNNNKNPAAKGKKDNKKKGGKKTPQGEIVVADFNQIDDWGWAPVSTDGMIMDDMDGFLCLEELDDVEISYEGTEATGRTVVFKVTATETAKANRPYSVSFSPMIGSSQK